MRQRAFGLIQRGLVGAGIDLRQEVALLDHLAFGEPVRLELSADLRLHRDVSSDVTVPSSFRMTRMSPLSMVAKPTGCGALWAPRPAVAPLRRLLGSWWVQRYQPPPTSPARMREVRTQ